MMTFFFISTYNGELLLYIDACYWQVPNHAHNYSMTLSSTDISIVIIWLQQRNYLWTDAYKSFWLWNINSSRTKPSTRELTPKASHNIVLLSNYASYGLAEWSVLLDKCYQKLLDYFPKFAFSCQVKAGQFVIFTQIHDARVCQILLV